MKKILAILLSAAMTLCLLAGCGGTDTKQNGDYTIVATVYPLYDWLVNLTKNAKKVDVKLLLDNGADIHSYQPTAEDMVTIKDSDCFVYVGGESDQWVRDAVGNFFPPQDESKHAISLLDILGGAAKTEQVVEGMQAEDEDAALDEHVWLSLKNAKLFCRELAAQLEAADPGNAETYRQNEAAYTEKLDALDQQYTEALTQQDKEFDTLLFGDRFPFRYLVDDYHLKYYAAFSGCSADSEASMETIAFLAEKLDELHLPAVLITETSDGKIAETIINTSQRKDAEILSLHSLQGIDADWSLPWTTGDGHYLETMEGNLDTLKKALKVSG